MERADSDTSGDFQRVTARDGDPSLDYVSFHSVRLDILFIVPQKF